MTVRTVSRRSSAATGSWQRLNEWRWAVLGLVVALTAGLGLWGFALYNEAHHQVASVWDQVYGVVQLFTINIGALDGPLPWQLIVARFGGVVVATSLGLIAFTAVFRDQTARIRLWRRRPDVVVLGLGPCGSRIARSFAAAGSRVAAVDQTNTAEVEACRRAGVIVLSGDATDEGTLAGVRVRYARRAVVMCGSESTNAEVLLGLRDEVDTERRRWLLGRRRARVGAPLECHVHIEDSQLCSLLRRAPGVGSGPALLTVSFFSPSARAAPAMLEQRPLDLVPRPPHLLIVGLGHMGRELAVHAARVWWFSGHRDPLTITVVDRHAQDRVAQLTALDPALIEHCVISLESLDVSSGGFVSAAFLDGDGESLGVTHVFVCLDDDVRAASATLVLQRRLRDKGMDVPVVVRMFHGKGLASLLDEQATVGTNPAMPFSLADWSCQWETLVDERTELVARALQRIYTRQCSENGDTPERNPAMGAWDDLREEDRDGCRDQAEDMERKLRSVGAVARPLAGWVGTPLTLTVEEVERLAEEEHNRWWSFKVRTGYRWGQGKSPGAKVNPWMVEWAELSKEVQDRDRAFVRALTDSLLRAGYLAERCDARAEQ